MCLGCVRVCRCTPAVNRWVRVHARRREHVLLVSLATELCVAAPLSLGTSEPREIPIPTDGPLQKFPFTSGLATPGSLRCVSRDRPTGTRINALSPVPVLYRADVAPLSRMQPRSFLQYEQDDSTFTQSVDTVDQGRPQDFFLGGGMIQNILLRTELEYL